MNRSLTMLLVLIFFSTFTYADPALKVSYEACDDFVKSTDNNIFTGTDLLYNCSKWSANNSNEESLSAEYARRYPTLNLSEIHKLAKVNEFKARAVLGRKYFLLHARFKRVTSDNGNLIFEVYNGGGNKYIADQISVPMEVYRPKLTQLWIWNETVKELDKKLPDFEDGDILTFVCSSKNWRVRSPYAEDFGGCVFWSAKK